MRFKVHVIRIVDLQGVGPWGTFHIVRKSPKRSNHHPTCFLNGFLTDMLKDLIKLNNTGQNMLYTSIHRYHTMYPVDHYSEKHTKS